MPRKNDVHEMVNCEAILRSARIVLTLGRIKRMPKKVIPTKLNVLICPINANNIVKKLMKARPQIREIM